MNPAEYKKMVEAIHKELEAALEQQEETERKIARLKQALVGLAPLADEAARPVGISAWVNNAVAEEWAAFSITDACRQIFAAAKAPLSPIEIKNQLVAMGQDLSNHKNVMASIHSMLKRLEQAGEIETKDHGLSYSREPITRRMFRPRRVPFASPPKKE